MVTPISQALGAYGTAANRSGGNTSGGATGSSFKDLLQGSLQSAVDTSRHAEGMSANALIGKADITDVVTAVSEAELTLQTVINIRDRVVTSLQEILRMPI